MILALLLSAQAQETRPVCMPTVIDSGLFAPAEGCRVWFDGVVLDCDADEDGDRTPNIDDCNPLDASIRPGVPDETPGVDSNCDCEAPPFVGCTCSSGGGLGWAWLLLVLLPWRRR
jgi:MYXO-CTERM domain-containing protein